MSNVLSLCLFLCLQFDMSSDRLLSEFCFGAIMMWYFSARHRLQCFVAGLYGAALWMIDHLMLNVLFCFLRFHIYFDSSVVFDFDLND